MEEALATDNIPVIDTSSIPADNMGWPADPTWEEIRVEIDRVLLSPAQHRVAGRPERRRAGRHVASMASILLVQARPG